MDNTELTTQSCRWTPLTDAEQAGMALLIFCGTLFTDPGWET